MIYLFGIYIGENSSKITYSGSKDYISLIVVIGIFYYHKYLMLKGLYLDYQFLQQVAMYPVVYLMLKISRSPFITNKIMHSRYISRIVDFIANHTLEMYMVHQTISGPIIAMKLIFPANVIVFIVLTLVLAALVNRYANYIRARVS